MSFQFTNTNFANIADETATNLLDSFISPNISEQERFLQERQELWKIYGSGYYVVYCAGNRIGVYSSYEEAYKAGNDAAIQAYDHCYMISDLGDIETRPNISFRKTKV